MNPALTNGQLTTLKTDITNTSAPTGQPGPFASTPVNACPNNSDGNSAIAYYYNQLASPTFTVWKTRVTVTQIGDAINGSELAGMTQLNVTRLQAIADHSTDGVNPSRTDRRQFYDDVFSGAGGAQTRTNLAALWRRFSSRVEKLYATGTGSDASPATMVTEGALTIDEVQLARNS